MSSRRLEDDGIPFEKKMVTLTSELADQYTESAKLEKAIRKNMKALGFELPKANVQCRKEKHRGTEDTEFLLRAFPPCLCVSKPITGRLNE